MSDVSGTSTLSDAKRALLAQRLHGGIDARQAISTIPRRSTSEHAPLSLGQQQLWLLDQMIGGSPVYSECVTIHIPSALDSTALERALNAFIHRHAAWRTIFPVIDGEPVQYVLPRLTLQLPLVDLSHLSEQVTGTRGDHGLPPETRSAPSIWPPAL